MKIVIRQREQLFLSFLLTGVLIAGCGGKVADRSGTTPVDTSTSAPPVTNAPGAAPPISPPPDVPVAPVAPVVPGGPPIVNGAVITDVKVVNLGGVAQFQVPISFGQMFKPGAFLATEQIAGAIVGGAIVPMQVDVKATYPDQSVRHAVISAVIPALAAGQEITVALQKSGAARISTPPPSLAQLLASGFDAKVTAIINGQTYTASASDQLTKPQSLSWLKGDIANEWLLAAPLRTAGGVTHPHLMARFDIRSYAGLNKAKVDVVLENDWAYAPDPANLIYDTSVSIAGNVVYSKTALTHYHHARWKKTFWWGETPALQIKPNIGYLIATRAIPNYDQAAQPSTTIVKQLLTGFSGLVTEPMHSGLATVYMPQTGGRPDIGLLPMWAVTYLLSQDAGVGTALFGTADLAGSWSIHYRDKITDRVVSLFDYPYMTLLGHPGDTFNPATGKFESFPTCGGDCSTPLSADSAHQPNFSYLPYLLSGDHYYLEEMQFWAMFNLFQHNPGYRDNIKGLVRPDQIRGQAWSMRLLSEAAAITPDTDPLKPQLTTLLANNLDWYNTTYAQNPSPDNRLGALINGSALVYDNGIGIAPWQDDFFTAAIGHASELGFDKAKTLLQWKAKFPVSRMGGTGYCWIDASIYKMIVRDTPTSATYTDIATAYNKSETPAVLATTCASAAMANALGKRTGEMVGYADSIDGFPSYLQGALAYSVDAGVPGANTAWSVFINRAIKPDYTGGAQFDILPR